MQRDGGESKDVALSFMSENKKDRKTFRVSDLTQTTEIRSCLSLKLSRALRRFEGDESSTLICAEIQRKFLKASFLLETKAQDKSLGVAAKPFFLLEILGPGNIMNGFVDAC